MLIDKSVGHTARSTLPAPDIAPSSFSASTTQPQEPDTAAFCVVVPILSPHLARELVALATALIGAERHGTILLTGIVVVPESSSLGEGASLVRAYRTLLHYMPADAQPNITLRTLVRVAHSVADGIAEVAHDQKADMLVLHWKGHSNTPGTVYGATLDQIMRDPPCNVVLARLNGQTTWPNVLLPVRGGSYNTLAVQVAQALGAERVTLLHSLGADHRVRLGSGRLVPNVAGAPFPMPGLAEAPAEQDAMASIHALLADLPPNSTVLTVRDTAVQAIIRHAPQHDLIIMGAAAHPRDGGVAERIARDLDTQPFIIVKTRKPHEIWREADDSTPTLATTLDRWFAENTYHYREFRSMSGLSILKAQQQTTISLLMPLRRRDPAALKTLHKAYMALVHEAAVVDEIVVVDITASANDVPTQQWQAALQALVSDPRTNDAIIYRALDMGEVAAGSTETALAAAGATLWRALCDNLIEGDIVAWSDMLTETFEPRSIYGLIGPLLNDSTLHLVCGFHSPSPGTPPDPVLDAGVRPILSAFAPQLAGIIDPFSASGAARRSLLQRCAIVEGVGFGVGLLADVLDLCGVQAISQVDLGAATAHPADSNNPDPRVPGALAVLMARHEARQQENRAPRLNLDHKTIRRVMDDDGGVTYRVQIKPFNQPEHPPRSYPK